ncbi:MAG: uracil-DNA glycosylase [Chloroflexi bacterium]|nr:uracil-DNA glycosylase [Chloroflexota bacterium]
MSEALAVIAQEVRTCTKCRLHEGARNGVPGEGNPNAEILFVGEGPGYHEDVQGRPFVGPAGKLLTEMLERAGLTRDEVFITNVVKHRPPGNRDPLPDEKEACSDYLERQIAAIQPILVVTLGRHSMMTFFGPTAKISQIHGTARPWRDILAYACFHPAAALHQPRFREALEQDFDGLPKALELARERAAKRRADRTDSGQADAPAGQGNDGSDPEQLTLF